MIRQRFLTSLIALGLLSAVAIGQSLTAASANPALWKAEGWKTDFSKSDIQFREILSGGPPRDGIPSIDRPVFDTVPATKQLSATEPVIQLTLNGDSRAYPLRILTWHEIVNDVVGGVPIAVTYCPLCNASIVFDRRLEGKVLDFGTTGKLRKSDLVMYDRQSESWWQQFTGKAIVGQHVGKELTMIPARVVSFSDFAKAHPDGKVLKPNRASLRPYGRNPYVNYDSRSAPYPLFTGTLPTGVNPMARVIVLRDLGEKKSDIKAITLSKLRQQGTVKLGEVTLVWQKGVNSALDAAHINQGRDIGSVSATLIIAGEPQEVVHDVTFAFVYHAFHPEGDLVQ